MAGGRRWGLVIVGALLLLSSVGVIGYSQLAQWQHTQDTRAMAPPPQSLPERLPVPTRARP